MIQSHQIILHSEGRFDVINITHHVADFVTSCGVQNGQVTVFFQHTTGAVIIGEHETGIVADLQNMFGRLAPLDYPYKHHIRGVDFNGHAHVRTALMPVSVTIPLIDGKMALGKYQDILVIDDQVDAEPRSLVIQVSGE
ncbi:MAG: YjbQ family protein [Anaerolineae bacterium]|nr:YjbQ family protein [Anaerolineae bacterium]